MAWVSPITWTSSLVTVAQFNEQIRDNLLALKDPPSASYTLDEASDYTTTSDSFTDVDSTNLSLTLDTGGGDVLVFFFGNARNSNSSGGVALNVSVDGTDLVGDDGLQVLGITETGTQTMGFCVLIEGLSAGSHTFRLRFKRTGGAGTAELMAGAGTSNVDIHPQFVAREVS